MRIELEEKQKRQKAMKSQRCWAFSLSFVMLVMIAIAIIIAYVCEQNIASRAKKTAQLSYDNEPDWKGIPGQYDIDINWNHYLYNCTNLQDVIFKGNAPEFMEFGPYIYRESDEYADVTY